MPTIYTLTEFVRDGGLIAYGPIFKEHTNLWATTTRRFSVVRKPSELPVAQSTRFALAINLKSARRARSDDPATLLAGADEVIE